MVKPVDRLLSLKPVVHGGLDYKDIDKKGIEPEYILDFSVSVNPLPVHPSIFEAFNHRELNTYPDTGCRKLKKAISSSLSVGDDSLLITNGTSQAIWLVSMAYLEKDDVVAVVTPTYGEYEQPAKALGANLSRWDIFGHIRDGLDPVPYLKEMISREKPKLLWICNPCNPTGYLLTTEEVETILDVCISSDTLLILDEAYINFVEGCPSSLPLMDRGNLLILRSMTKDYGVPGVRLGYCVGPKEAILAMSLVQPDWSVNGFAQSVGVALIENDSYYRGQWCKVRTLKKKLVESLVDVGLEVVEGQGNFILCYHEESHDLMKFLKSRHIQVRDCSSFDMKGFFRIGIKDEASNLKLIETISEFFNGSVSLVLGGARSGKSSFAQELVEATSEAKTQRPVYYLATSKILDQEMERRVARHRSDRPDNWITIEEPLLPSLSILKLPLRSIVLLDCITMLVTNIMLKEERNWDSLSFEDEKILEEKVLSEMDNIVESAKTRSIDLVLVSNELGSGLVPPYSMGRVFRDLAGWANQRLGRRSDRLYRLTAGVPQILK